MLCPNSTTGHVLHPVVGALHEHVDVVHQAVPAVGAEHAEPLLRTRGGAVAAVVLALHEEARGRERRGEVVVAQQVLAHAVGELHDPARARPTAPTGRPRSRCRPGR
jgi:hypothetical protein